MTLAEAMKEIESHTFAAKLSVASNFQTFWIAARAEESVRYLSKELDKQVNLSRVFKRIGELSRQEMDLRYENQWDTALAVYLLLIKRRDIILAKMAAEMVARVPQCWWASKISYKMLLEETSQTDTKTLETESAFEMDLITVTRNSVAGDANIAVRFSTDPSFLTVAKSCIDKTEFYTNNNWFLEPDVYRVNLHNESEDIIAQLG